MAEKEREKERLKEEEISPKLYYDYEGRFIKQKLERERMELLPRVVKPELFAKGGHALGDLRVFERFTVGPLSALTCGFLDVKPGESTELKRMIPSEIFYILEGSGVSVQDGKKYEFSQDDLVVIPPYTTYKFEADKKTGFRAWTPQVRLWHVTGLLWQENFEFKSLPEGTEAIKDGSGKITGFKVPQGVLGLERDLEVRAGADPKREKVFEARRKVRKPAFGKTKYDWYLNLLAEENALEEKGPRIIRGADRPWEDTRQGRLRFYISHWTEVAAQTMDMMVYQIGAGNSTGQHRHIFEELILVTAGKGHDVQEGTSYAWEAGDLICVPPMTAHQHHNDGKETAQLISVWSRQAAHEFLGGIEQIGFATGWKS